MKKKLITFLILFLMTSAVGQEPYMKPMLGKQLNWGHPLSKGLVAFWLMNEGAGNTVNDLTGNGYVGTLTNSPTWVPGRNGSVLDIVTGTPNPHVVTSANVSKLQNKTEMTFIIGCKVELCDTVNRGFCGNRIEAGGVKGYLLWLGDKWDNSNPETFTFIRKYATTNQAATAPDNTIVLNEWGFIAITISNNEIPKMYYGCESKPFAELAGLQDTAAGTGVMSDDTGLPFCFGIGGATLVNNHFDGKIDFVFVYDRALSASEIEQIYREPFCMIAEDLPVAMMYNYTPAGGVVVTPYYYRGLLLIPVIPFSIYYLRRRRCAA